MKTNVVMIVLVVHISWKLIEWGIRILVGG